MNDANNDVDPDETIENVPAPDMFETIDIEADTSEDDDYDTVDPEEHLPNENQTRSIEDDCEAIDPTDDPYKTWES